MNNDVKLRFKGYEFAYNPQSLRIKKERNIIQINSPISGSIIQDLGFSPAVITGEGAFYGCNAKKQYDELYSLFAKKESGVLHIKEHKPFYAFFVAVAKEMNPDTINYSFKFIEDCQKPKEWW